jgi:HNH endonuclease
MKKLDLLNKKFGKLLAIEKTNKRKDGKVIWKCLCDCGNIVEVVGKSLKNGTTKSCGCIRIKELKGKRFGRLLVLENTFTKNNSNYIWKCLCDCGNIVEIAGSSLTGGYTKSCGCLNKEIVSKLNTKNLKGERFGKLIAIENTRKKSYNCFLWKCICDCGKETEVKSSSLINGHTKSCGCLQREMSSEKNIKNIKGQRFGKLIAIRNTRKKKKTCYIWECLCDCGNTVEVIIKLLMDGSTKSCGCLHKESVKKGEESHSWKGGVTEKNITLYDTYAKRLKLTEKVRRNEENKDILEVRCKYCKKWFIPKMTAVNARLAALNGVKGSGDANLYCSDECKQLCPIYGKRLYQENHPNKPKRLNPYKWSKAVLEKFNYTCEICGSKENLEAHHILPVKTNQELVEDVNNGACLCHDCHMKHGHKDECSLSNLRNIHK